MTREELFEGMNLAFDYFDSDEGGSAVGETPKWDEWNRWTEIHNLSPLMRDSIVALSALVGGPGNCV